MLETIREYALEQLAESGDGEAVRRRHAGLYRGARRGRPSCELLGPHSCLARPARGRARQPARGAHLGVGEQRAGTGPVGAALWRFWQHREDRAEGREHLERLLAMRLRLDGRASRRLKRGSRRSRYVQGDHEAVRRLGRGEPARLSPDVGDDQDGRTARSASSAVASAIATGEADRAHGARRGRPRGRAANSGDLSTEAVRRRERGVWRWRAYGELEGAERLLSRRACARARRARERHAASGIGLRALGADRARPGATTRRRARSARGEPRHSPHARRPVGDLPLALETSRSCRSGGPRQRGGAAPGSRRASRSSGRVGESAGAARRTSRCWRAAGGRGGSIRCAPLRLYGCASVLREAVGRRRLRSRAGRTHEPRRRPAPLRARRGSIRRGHGSEGRGMTLDEAASRRHRGRR